MKTPLKAIIVDDEHLARAVVREYLQNHPDIEIVAECSNGFDAVKAVMELHPDILFLDIQMPRLNGFEVLELIDPQPGVVFITAYDEYALRAFEVHAVDYLMKPFSAERFASALERVKERISRDERPSLRNLSSEAHTTALPTERLLFRDGSKVHIIPVERIDYIEAQDDYVSVLAEGKKWLKQVTLSALEADLDGRRFVRIHRSYILNIDRLVRIELYAKDSREAILKDGAKLPLSRSGYAKLRDILA